MRTVWKFPLRIEDSYQHVPMPDAAAILHAEMQHGRLCLWALVDDSHANEDRVFRVFGTGHDTAMDKIAHVSTVQDGPFMWHVFEVLRRDAVRTDAPEQGGGDAG